MASSNKKKVLFLSTGNSVRSQIAEVLLKNKAGELYDVFSAGTQPDGVDERTLDVLKKFGLAPETLSAKNVSSFEGEVFDYVITLCDTTHDVCRSYPNAIKQFSWDLPDAKERGGNDPFTVTFNEINNRLSMFLLIEETNSSSTNKTNRISTEINNEQSNAVEPLSFYKTLTDEIRLKTLMLSHYHGELCVCELMTAMDEDSQPKVSRNLAVLKKAKVIVDRKHGQWVFYRINPELPLWAKSVIAQTTENNIPMITDELQRLAKMKNRPDRSSFCK